MGDAAWSQITEFFFHYMMIGIVVISAIFLAVCSSPIMAKPTKTGLAKMGSDNGRPQHSTSMAITDDGRYLLTANPDSNTVSLIKTDTALLLTEIPVGVDPRSVAITSNGATAYIANQGSDTIFCHRHSRPKHHHKCNCRR